MHRRIRRTAYPVFYMPAAAFFYGGYGLFLWQLRLFSMAVTAFFYSSRFLVFQVEVTVCVICDDE